MGDVELELQRTVNAPAADVFARLADIEGHNRWMPAKGSMLRRTRQTSPGSPAVGTTYEDTTRMGTMQGEIVELSTAQRIYTDAQHPYTRRLLSSFPSLSGSRGAFIRTGVDEGSPVDTDTRSVVLPTPDDLEEGLR